MSTKRIAALEKQLVTLRAQLDSCTDPEEAGNLGEKIDYIQDDIDELEAAEREQDSYEEMTGTTPQDLYNNRNSYAIAQSERYDQFRAEY